MCNFYYRGISAGEESVHFPEALVSQRSALIHPRTSLRKVKKKPDGKAPKVTGSCQLPDDGVVVSRRVDERPVVKLHLTGLKIRNPDKVEV